MNAVHRAQRERLRLWLRVTAAALPLALLGLVVGTVRFSLHAQAADTEARRQIALNQGIRQLQEILLAAGDAETGQRGYLLTGRPTYLQPYRLAADRLPKMLERLDDVPLETDAFTERVASVKDTTAKKLAELAETIRLFDEGRLDAALALMDTDKGKRYMDFLRVELDDAMRQIREDRDAATAAQLKTIATLREQTVWTVTALVFCVIAAAIQIALLTAAQRRHARQLAESEARHRSIVEEQQELVSLASPDGTLRYVNPAYGRHFNRTPESLLGTSLFDLVANEDRVLVRQQLDEVLQSSQPVRGENRVVGNDGRTRWISWTNSVQHRADGEQLLHSVGRDVTERRLAEDALRMSEGLLARTGRVAGVGGWELDLETGRMQLSAEMKHLHEVPEDHAPTLEEALAAYDPADSMRLRQAIHAARDRGVPFDIELRLVTGRGRRIWVRAAGQRDVGFEAGNLRIVGACQDITSRKDLELRLREVNEIFEHSPDLIVQADRSGAIHYMNPAARKALAIGAREDVSRRIFREFNTPETNALYEQEIMPAVKRSGMWLGETTVMLAGGLKTPVNHLVIAHRDPNGWIARCSAVMRDISTEVAARAHLARQTATLGAVIEAIPAMVAVLDTQPDTSWSIEPSNAGEA